MSSPLIYLAVLLVVYALVASLDLLRARAARRTRRGVHPTTLTAIPRRQSNGFFSFSERRPARRLLPTPPQISTPSSGPRRLSVLSGRPRPEIEGSPRRDRTA